jgi:hypothetical protein
VNFEVATEQGCDYLSAHEPAGPTKKHTLVTVRGHLRGAVVLWNASC